MPATATRRVPSRPRQAVGAAPLAALPLAALNLAGLLLALAPLAAHAQGRASASSPAGGAASVAAAESASAARAAWRRAGEAMRARNPDSARRELARASAAWPTQPAYAWMLARMSAAAGDTASVAAALGHVASLGLTGDLKSDTTLARVAASPALAATVARLEENAREIARSRAKLTLPDSTFWPEGIDHDARTGAWYVTSIRHRTVAEVGADGRVRELWPREAKGIGAVFGVRVDPREPVLWVTTAAYAGMSGEPLNHEEVLEAGKSAATRMGELLTKIVPRI